MLRAGRRIYLMMLLLLGVWQPSSILYHEKHVRFGKYRYSDSRERRGALAVLT